MAPQSHNSGDGPTRCNLCDRPFTNEGQLEEHQGGKPHRFMVITSAFRTANCDVPEKQGKRNGVHIFLQMENPRRNIYQYMAETATLETVCNLTNNNDRASYNLHFHVKNDNKQPVVLEKSEFFVHGPSSVYDLINGDDIQVRPQKQHIIKFRMMFREKARIRIWFRFVITVRGNPVEFIRMAIIHCQRVQEIETDLQPTEPFTRIRSEFQDTSELILIEGYKPQPKTRSDLKSVHKLEYNSKEYKISNQTRERVIKWNKQLNEGNGVKIPEFDLNDLQYDIYFDHWKHLVMMEEIAQEEQLKMFALGITDGGVTMTLDEDLVELHVPGIADEKPSLIIQDKVIARQKYATRNSSDVDETNKGYFGVIHEIDKRTEKIKLGFKQTLNRKICEKPDLKFEIHFVLNRTVFLHQYQAAQWAADETLGMKDMLFPTLDTIIGNEVDSGQNSTISRFHNPLVEKNAEQRLAVENIVAGSCAPAPYILFGPPGTGKTVTIIEAIQQLTEEHDSSSRILVCTPQNFAADNVTEKLLKQVSQQKRRTDKLYMLRLNALSRQFESLPPFLRNSQNRAYVNYRKQEHVGGASLDNNSTMESYIPDKDELKHYKIIVCTLMTAARLAAADMMEHFTHIVVDEAGQASEPETLVALSRMIDFNIDDRRKRLVVLAGDPMQLGPVIFSQLAQKNKLDISLMERLMMTRDLYSEPYNSRFIAKLVKNFRSNENILQIPNENFYDGELQACAAPEDKNKFMKFSGLPALDFPLIYQHVQGMEMREGKSPSWYNPDEVIQVIKYITELTEGTNTPAKDIGVITPYNKQVVQIKKGLRAYLKKHTTFSSATSDFQRSMPDNYFDDLMIGSPEKFQGQERPVIIISTVRSRDENQRLRLGFLKNRKRFNVAVTRAKSLLILIGNRNNLAKDHRNWGRLIDFIDENDGLKMDPHSNNEPTDF